MFGCTLESFNHKTALLNHGLITDFIDNHWDHCQPEDAYIASQSCSTVKKKLSQSV